MSSPLPTSLGGNPALVEILAQRLAQSDQHRITFAEYMDLVLYHPQEGYYSRERSPLGPQGDFLTAPYLGSEFGELLAVQFAEMWGILGKPQPWQLVEMGAGQGLLAVDILRSLKRHDPDCWQALIYTIVERSPSLRQSQQQHLAAHPELASKVCWQALEEFPPDSIVGCCFSNELVDAFPVHQIEVHQGKLQEVYVTTQDSSPPGAIALTQVLGQPSTPQLLDYWLPLGLDLTAPIYPEGYRTEVSLAALDWLQTIAERLQRGYLLTIDYGYPAHRYYSPSRSTGTLQCYYHHRFHDNPYIHIGEQDLTTHVNWTALEQEGDRWGLTQIGFRPQGLFLMALGLGDRLAAISSPAEIGTSTRSDMLKRHGDLHQLINPLGMGNFGVLIQGKDLGPQALARPLRGLQDPTGL